MGQIPAREEGRESGLEVNETPSVTGNSKEINTFRGVLLSM